jgi:hypothetical protein
MQEKESKSKWHFIVSLIKSVIRIGAGLTLMYGDLWYLNAAGGMLVGAEMLGILEEL